MSEQPTSSLDGGERCEDGSADRLLRRKRVVLFAKKAARIMLECFALLFLLSCALRVFGPAELVDPQPEERAPGNVFLVDAAIIIVLAAFAGWRWCREPRDRA